MKKSVTDLSKHLLEHWVIYLLGSGGIASTVLGWLYRTHLKNWLLSEHSVGMSGLVWVLCIVIVVVISAMFPVIVYIWRMQKGRVISDVNDIQIHLYKWWIDWKSNASPIYNKKDSNIATRFVSGFYVIECSKVDNQLRLKKNSTIKYLPEIIKKEEEYKIMQQGQHTLKLTREISINPEAQKFAQRMSEGLGRQNI